MSRRRSGRPSGGGDDEQHAVAFAGRGHAGAVSTEPVTTSPPPKLFFGCSVEEITGETTALMSPTSILQTAAVSPMSPTTTVPFSRAGVGSGERWSRCQRPWETKPVGLGLVVGALKREDAPAEGVSTVVTGQIKMTCRLHASPAYRRAFGCMDDFLRRCHGCSKELGQGRDIFMYRGERAFCSRECRYREMLHDDNGTEF